MMAQAGGGKLDAAWRTLDEYKRVAPGSPSYLRGRAVMFALTGPNINIIVNGTEMNKVTGCNLKEGQIGLQSEGAGIEVRKVTIEPLTP